MNQLEAASIIENQAIKSLMYKMGNKLNHPVRLIQASKSLIGLNLDNPNEKLLNFNSIYLEKIDYKLINKINFSTDHMDEVISIHDLEKAFLDNDRARIFYMLGQLSKVSSSLHILEYLIEISLKQSGNSFLIIWSIYRIIFFINKKDIELFIDLSIDVICKDKFQNNNNFLKNKNKFISYSNLSVFDIDLFSHLLEAYNTNLVRSGKIQPLISNMIATKANSYKKNIPNDISEKIEYIELLKIGRYWLLDFFDKIDKNKITIEFILFLDSIRCLFKFLNKSEHKLICIHFERLVKIFNV